MKTLTVSALLCALLALTRATSPAEGQNDTETEEPTESTPEPSEEGPGAEHLHVGTIPPTAVPTAIYEEGPGAERLHVGIIPPTAIPTAIYDDYGFHDYGFHDYGFHDSGAENSGFSCPDGWTTLDTRCLLYISQNMSWTNAEDNCQSGNGNFNAYGNLASVFEENHFDEIQDLIQTADRKSGQVWVGGYKEDSSWSWSDYMSPSIFSNWCSGEPSKGNCLKINFEENPSGCLESSSCDAELPSVCSIFLM